MALARDIVVVVVVVVVVVGLKLAHCIQVGFLKKARCSLTALGM